MTSLKKRWRIYLYVLPTFLLIFAITIFPLLYSVRISFYHYLLQTGAMTFAWFSNYLDAIKDAKFHHSLLVTLKIGLPSLFLEFVLGLLLALLLNSIKRGKVLFTSLLATPVMIAPAAAALSFRLLYTPEWGPINPILSFILGRPIQIDWLGSTTMAPISTVIVDVWQMTPFIMLILLAGLTSIPDELYEAARIDGAASWQLFLHLTLPLLRFSIGVALILRAIDLFKMFDLVLVLTHGGPAGANETVSFYIYQTGLQFLRVGYAAALSFILLFLVVLMSRFFLRFMRREEVVT